MSSEDTGFGVSIDPGALRFSAAHFITYEGICENLHGHNFHARVEAFGPNTPDAFVVDFVKLTELATGICDELHDKVLLPGISDEVALSVADGQVSVQCYGRRFALPEGNCCILPVPNTTAEMLAWYIGDRLLAALREHGALGNVRRLQVAVEEADRQWGVCRREL